MTDSVQTLGRAAAPIKSSWSPRAVSAASIAGFVLLYTAVTASGAFPAQVLVPPSAILAALQELLQRGELAHHLAMSLRLLALGFVCGSALGLMFGVLMGLSDLAAALFAPLFNAIRQIPSIAFIPLLILILGIDDTFKVFVVAKAAFFPVALAAYDAVRGVTRSYFEVAALYRLPLRLLIGRIVVPATTPAVITGLRLGLGRSWGVLVGAELYASEAGIGQMMEMGRQLFRIDVVMVGVLVIAALGLTFDRAFLLLERRLVAWRYR